MLRSIAALSLVVVSTVASAQDACPRGFDVAQELLANPWSVKFQPGDVNGDGLLDFVGRLHSDVHVLLNRGNGVFEPRNVVRLPFDFQGWTLRLDDVTGDGRLDVILRDRTVVLVTAGAGDGTFGPLVATRDMPLDDSFALFVDMNGDGRRDFVSYGGEREVLTHTAERDGTFRAAPPQPARATWMHDLTPLQAGDFDGDGRTDLVYVSTTDRDYLQLQMLWQNSDGSFDSRYFEFHEFPIRGAQVGPLEMDGDPNMELVALHGGRLYVFDGEDRRFTVRSSPVDGPVLNLQYPMTTTDLDRDGLRDLIFHGAATTVLWGEATGAYTQASFDFVTVSLADLNGDGTKDLISDGPMLMGVIYATPGSRALRAAPVIASPRTTRSLYEADFDRDGDADLARGNGDVETTLFRRDGATYTEVLTIRGQRQRAAADVDNDGYVDLVTEAGQYGGPTYVHFGTGDFAFTPPLEIARGQMFEGVAARSGGGHLVIFRTPTNELESISVMNRTPASSILMPLVNGDVVAIVDVDGDGDSDFVIGDRRSNHRMLIQDGANWSTRALDLPLDTDFRHVGAGDIDRDGRRDLVLYGRIALLGQPDGTFAPSTMWNSTSGAASHLVDIDRDGWLDIVSAGCDAGCAATIQRNTGRGFEPYGAFGINSLNDGHSVIEDVDRDGWPDLVVAVGGGLVILRNECARPAVTAVASPARPREGDPVTLLVNAHTRGLFSGRITIRKNGAIVAFHQPERSDSFSAATFALPPLPVGTHTFEVEYADQRNGKSSTTVTVTIDPRVKRRRTVRH